MSPDVGYELQVGLPLVPDSVRCRPSVTGHAKLYAAYVDSTYHYGVPIGRSERCSRTALRSRAPFNATDHRRGKPRMADAKEDAESGTAVGEITTGSARDPPLVLGIPQNEGSFGSICGPSFVERLDC